MNTAALAALSLAALLAGCTVGPDYRKPAPAVANQWIEPGASGEVERRWWDRFGDPVLSDLVQRAFAGSWDLAEARARIAEARAERQAAAGGALPQVDATGSLTRNVISENGQLPIANIPGFDRSFPLFDLGFDASWEIDLWGRNRRQVEAAEARVEAAEWTRRDLMLSVAAEVARAYLDLRSAQAQAGFAAEDLRANQELARLTALRREAGEATAIDAEQASAASASSARALHQAEAAIASSGYRIATLLGVAPETFVPALIASRAPQPLPPATIARGIRAGLLERRPDVRRAERELAAATAEIGVATADLFPRFSLTGSIGQQSRRADDLTSADSSRLALGPSFSWPLFSGGRIRALIRGASARADAAAARYERAVITALSDSESAANRYARAAGAHEAAERALAAERAAFRLAELRTLRGEDDRLALTRAHLRLLQAEQGARSTRADYANAAVALYKALGGGWEDQADGPARP